MKPRTLRRHFRESFKNLRRNGWMTFAAVSAVTVTLLLTGIFLVIMLNLNKAGTDIENDVEVRVHIKLDTTEAEKEQLKKQISSLPEVESIAYSSKEQELQNLIKDMGNDYALFEQSNPLYDVYIVKTARPQDTPDVARKIEQFAQTEKAVYGEEEVKNLFSFMKTARNVGAVLVAGLLFTAMFLISNTIKITIFARRKEIEIMKLVGATNWFIRWPFLLEGLWIGLLGSILPIAAIAVGYYYVEQALSAKLAAQLVEFIDYLPLVLPVTALMLVMAVFIGIWGSFLSVRRFLKI
ncbi:permease-like cell division protein FtsX [Domibacillus sp. DTU_2020_1001157_1_SI_ALB_TIR_016]|uniref:permease-like cell division protein FtsX n=1 Tax=Domibacillus sp. DTU_2020_1001157_1_SI_ALB_TIR_016 TaxID=3077789 RepID=UPI0028EA8EB6|nr:permease-like cell division protein FtsX [Domibacillus sp. DTU_2020_1001157_1_SI_ALB_TIR_016]WNS81337.1 permease-like cell division protein FtsX [Domibacillus sp. DTU_2020_1001157_1_SI_ALB_TIR_016]